MIVDSFSTHYITLDYRLLVGDKLLNLSTEQYNQYKWFSEEQLLIDSHVHKQSRWYFDSSVI